MVHAISFFDFCQAARALGRSRAWVYRLAAKGQIHKPVEGEISAATQRVMNICCLFRGQARRLPRIKLVSGALGPAQNALARVLLA
jgi:hypothetical protein